MAARIGAKKRSASYWLCARHRSAMFSTVASPLAMYGARGGGTRGTSWPRTAVRRPPTKAHCPSSRAHTARCTCAGTSRDASSRDLGIARGRLVAANLPFSRSFTYAVSARLTISASSPSGSAWRHQVLRAAQQRHRRAVDRQLEEVAVFREWLDRSAPPDGGRHVRPRKAPRQELLDRALRLVARLGEKAGMVFDGEVRREQAQRRQVQEAIPQHGQDDRERACGAGGRDVVAGAVLGEMEDLRGSIRRATRSPRRGRGDARRARRSARRGRPPSGARVRRGAGRRRGARSSVRCEGPFVIGTKLSPRDVRTGPIATARLIKEKL